MSQAPGRRSSWGEAQRSRERQLLADFGGLSPDDPHRPRIRDELVTMHLPLVHHLARRYADRGENLEDLTQVGTIGLIKAIDRFDPAREVELATFATPTILGEIKRHFRDRTWALKVPRRMQELSAQVTACTDRLTRTLHRPPTVRELAAALDVHEQDVLDALETRHAHSTDPIDDGDADRPSVGDSLGIDDPALEAVEYREALKPLLEELGERERRIILLRFFHNRTQSQIAEQLGISQMHVSRLLAKSLTQLREGLAAG